MKKITFLILVLYWGCNLSSTAHYLVPEYASSRRFSANILVMPLTPAFLDLPVRDSLFAGGRADFAAPDHQELVYFNNYFGPLVSEYSTAEVIGIDPFFRTAGVRFGHVILTIEDQISLQLLAPESGSIVYRNRVPDFVLFTQDLNFEKDFIEERNGIGEGATSKYTMVSSLKYLFWDNHNHRIAGYGQIENRRQILVYPGKTIYLDVLDEFVREIIDNSPLVRRQIRQ